jgi:hypothetical protein
VEWTESKDKQRSFHQLDFANAHTPKSREEQNIPSTTAEYQSAAIIDMFTCRRLH